MDGKRQEQIAAFCTTAIGARVFPGCVVGYVRDGMETIVPFGRLTYQRDAPAVTGRTVYDMASVTKAIPTSCVILRLVELGRLRLDDLVVAFIPEISNRYRDEMLIRHLLTFTVAFDLGRTLASIAREEPTRMLEILFRAPLLARPGAMYTYTNAPSLLLGLVAERVMGQPLDRVAQELFFGPLGMDRSTFYPEAIPVEEVAPSEIDSRGEVREQVHDPAAWAMVRQGRIPGHAGLFSTAGDVLKFVRMLLDEGTMAGKQFFTPETVRAMHTSQIPDLGVRAGLGWEMGRPEAQGTQVSNEAFGKTGFTGASVVIDPAQKIGLVFLSNRTYPRRGDRERILAVWRGLADLVFG